MDCVCRLGSLGNSGSATTGDGGPNCGCKLSRFLFLCPLCVFKQSFSSSCHPPLFLCLILSYYSGARVFERIPVHEFHIFCSHTEWNWFSLLCSNGGKLWGRSAEKLNSKLISMFRMRVGGLGRLYPRCID